jgi:phosphonate transport system substrate-binding protein
MASRDTVAFGYPARAQSAAARKQMREFAAMLGKAAGAELTVTSFPSYDGLAKAAHKGTIDLAWLPPIPFIALERRGDVTPLVSNHRGGVPQFHGVLIVRTASSIQSPADLRGTRAAWVDRRSASGFVFARIELAARGVDPRITFAEQKFYGSHDAVVRAVVGAKADVGATYARLDRSGGAVDGAWAELPGAEESIRVLLSFGRIPGDVLASRATLDPALRERLTRALVGICHDVAGSMLVRKVFGVHEFRRWKAEGYDELHAATARAASDGLLDDDAVQNA